MLYLSSQKENEVNKSNDKKRETNAAKKNLPNVTFRTDYSEGDPDKEAHLYVLKNTKCPAVLTENMFQDNKDDVVFLLSDEGFHELVRLHVEGIVNYIKDN